MCSARAPTTPAARPNPRGPCARRDAGDHADAAVAGLPQTALAALLRAAARRRAGRRRGRVRPSATGGRPVLRGGVDQRRVPAAQAQSLLPRATPPRARRDRAARGHRRRPRDRARPRRHLGRGHARGPAADAGRRGHPGGAPRDPLRRVQRPPRRVRLGAHAPRGRLRALAQRARGRLGPRPLERPGAARHRHDPTGHARPAAASPPGRHRGDGRVAWLRRVPALLRARPHGARPRRDHAPPAHRRPSPRSVAGRTRSICS